MPVMKHGNARALRRHVAAVGEFRRIGDVERAFDRGRRRAAVEPVIEGIDQHADAHDVGEQDELLPLVVALLADAGEEIDRRRPFGLGRLDVAHEGVEVLDEGLHDLLEPRVGYRLPALEHDVGQVLFGHIGHATLRKLLR